MRPTEDEGTGRHMSVMFVISLSCSSCAGVCDVRHALHPAHVCDVRHALMSVMFVMRFTQHMSVMFVMRWCL